MRILDYSASIRMSVTSLLSIRFSMARILELSDFSRRFARILGSHVKKYA